MKRFLWAAALVGSLLAGGSASAERWEPVWDRDGVQWSADRDSLRESGDMRTLRVRIDGPKGRQSKGLFRFRMKDETWQLLFAIREGQPYGVGPAESEWSGAPADSAAEALIDQVRRGRAVPLDTEEALLWAPPPLPDEWTAVETPGHGATAAGTPEWLTSDMARLWVRRGPFTKDGAPLYALCLYRTDVKENALLVLRLDEAHQIWHQTKPPIRWGDIDPGSPDKALWHWLRATRRAH